MAKCIHCGKSTLAHGHVKLADAVICGKCFRALGFDNHDVLTSSSYKYDEIKNGRDAYYKLRIAKRIMANKDSYLEVQNHGQIRDLKCTDEEQQIYDRIIEVLSDAGVDISPMELVRKSDDYVSACMKSSGDYGDMDIARFKYTDRAKWIKTGDGFKKFSISAPTDVLSLSEELLYQYQLNEPYL